MHIFCTPEEEYRKRITQAQQKASIDALTGIKNKHAYVDAEESLNRQALKNGGIVLACGTARFEEGKDCCVATVFERADQIMYENKNYLKSGCKG